MKKKSNIKVTKKIEKEMQILQENPVYLKLEYNEAIESKTDLLHSEISFLNLMKIMKRYNALKMEELRIKSEIYKAIRELDASVKKTKSSFPFLKIPERAKREEIIKREASEEIKPTGEAFDENLESELKSIQDRLKSIGK